MLNIILIYFFPLGIFYYLNQQVFDTFPKWRKAFGYSALRSSWCSAYHENSKSFQLRSLQGADATRMVICSKQCFPWIMSTLSFSTALTDTCSEPRAHEALPSTVSLPPSQGSAAQNQDLWLERVYALLNDNRQVTNTFTQFVSNLLFP